MERDERVHAEQQEAGEDVQYGLDIIVLSSWLQENPPYLLRRLTRVLAEETYENV